MKKWREMQGFTLSELLLAMGVFMFCVLLIERAMHWMTIMLTQQSYLVQDQMAVLQLRLDIAQCDQVFVEEGNLITVQNEKTATYSYHNHRLVKRPGDEIFIQDIEGVQFEDKYDAIFVDWRREGKQWNAKVTK